MPMFISLDEPLLAEGSQENGPWNPIAALLEII